MFVVLFESPQTSSEISWNKIIKHSYRAPTVLQVSFHLFYTKTQRSEN